ncbi:putative F-box/FBD/LRR-repeat protein At4g03220 [Diospyros lotus]|uniref:putative F-box/FBD/LRR-repeat protein At4g03220 n=1 Tax=Diospyros lotus TaxID=55363 RepID=UPI00224FF42F|nr:putative F-box/FBD/LRR-repeat protein At4g03220 [Diospyros lotus]
METRSAKRKRLQLRDEHEADPIADVDQISDLPDAVLHRILFLLPIKSVAQTSVLSKRWRWLWSSFPDLDFTTVSHPIPHFSSSTIITSGGRKRVHSPVAKSMDFISNVLALRDKHSDLRTLRFCAQLSFSRLNSLIRCAVRNNVQELDVEVATNDYFNFPRSVITCESLRIFKLKSRYPGFRLPPSPIMKSGFLSLQTLSLSLIILYDQPSLLDLFTASSFPLLKKLNLDACFGLKHLTVGCRALEDLTLENCFQLHDLSVCCGKLERLRVASCFDAYGGHSWVKIDAPRLRTFLWEYNAITESSSLENLDSINEASVGFFVLQEEITAAKRWSLANFLTGLSRAQCFTLESQCVELLSRNNHFASVLLQPFNNLKTLELRTELDKHNIPALACLFRSSPTLHTLIIKIINDHKIQRRQWNRELWDLSSSGEERFWESQSQALKQFLNHLKVVTIHGFSQCENDVILAKFLLKHAKVLQEMTLCSGHYTHRDSLRRERIKSQMMGFSKASSNAQISFL